MRNKFLTGFITTVLCFVTAFSFAACSGYTTLQTDEMIAQLRAEINALEDKHDDDLATLNAEYKAKDDQLLASIQTNQQAIATLKADYDAQIASLQTQITANKNAIDNANGGYVGSLEGYVTEDDLKELKDDYDAKIANLQSQITATVNEIARAEQAYITALEGYVKTADFNAYKDEISLAIATLQNQITANQTAIANLDAKYTEELENFVPKTDYETYKSETADKIDAIETQITANANAIARVESEYKVALESYLKTADFNTYKAETLATIVNLQEQIDENETAIANLDAKYTEELEKFVLKTDYDAYKNEVNGKIADLQSQITANETAIENLDVKYIAELEKLATKSALEELKSKHNADYQELVSLMSGNGGMATEEGNALLIKNLRQEYEAKVIELVSADTTNADKITALTTKHNNEVAELQNQINANKTAIDEHKSAYNDKLIELANKDTANADAIASLTTKHNEDIASLQAKITANENAIKECNDDYTALLARIATLETQGTEHADAIADLTDKYNDKVSQYGSQIDILTVGLANLRNDYNAKIVELANADSANADAIADLTTKHDEDIASLQNKITANETAIDQHKSAYADKLVELASADSANAQAIATLRSDYESRIDELQDDIDSNLAKINETDSKYEQELATLAGKVEENKTAIAELTSAYNAKVSALEDKIEELENKIKTITGEYDLDLTPLENAIAEANAKIDANKAELDGRISALETKHDNEIDTLNGLIVEIQNTDATQNDKIAELENKVNALIAGIDRVVTFDRNDGSAVEKVTVKNGEKVEQPTNPTKVGYTFGGWYGGKYGDEKWVFIGYPVTENITLTAKWIANEYTVSFDSAGGAGEYANQTATYGEEFTLPTAPSKVGYTFDGWYNGNDKMENGAWTTDSSVDLVAKWTANKYAVTFDTAGGEGEYNDQTATYGEEFTLPTAPVKEHYNFLGWYNGDEKMYDGEWTATESINLVAKWEVKYNFVTFVGNGSTGGEMEVVKVENAQTALTLNAFEKTGYIFAGWSDTTDGAVTYFDGDYFVPGEELNYTLYARWVDANSDLGQIATGATVKTYLDDTNDSAEFDFGSVVTDSLYENQTAKAVAGSLSYNGIAVSQYSIENGIYKVNESEFKAGNGKQLSGETSVGVKAIIYENNEPVGFKTVTAKLIIVTKVLRTSDDLKGWYNLAKQDWVAEVETVTGKNQVYGGYFELGNNIKLEGSYITVYSWFSGVTKWNADGGFQGTFDGCGYAIDGYTVGSYQGFFGGVVGRNGVIKNIAFTNVTQTATCQNVLGQNLYGGKVENVYVHLKNLNQGGSPNGASAFFFETKDNATVNNVAVLVDSLGYTADSLTGNDMIFTNIMGKLNAGSTMTNVIAVTAGEATIYNMSTSAEVMSQGSIYGYDTYAQAVAGKANFASVINAMTASGVWTTNSDGMPVFKSLAYPTDIALVSDKAVVGGTATLDLTDAFYNGLTTWSVSTTGASVSGNVLTLADTFTAETVTVTANNGYGLTKQFTLTAVQPKRVNGIAQEMNKLDDTTNIRITATGELASLTLGGKAVASYEYTSGEGIVIPQSAYPASYGVHTLKALTFDGTAYTLTTLDVDYATMVISNKAELLAFANLPRQTTWGVGELYVLNADIDMQGADYGINIVTNGSNNLSSSTIGFGGTFDGRGYIIKNINMVGNGFISGVRVTDGFVKNITFLNATQSGEGFLSTATPGGNFENIYIQVTPATTAKYVFGTDNYGSSRYKNIIVDVPYKSGNYYLQGTNYNRNYGSFTNVYAVGVNNEGEYLVAPKSAWAGSQVDSLFAFDNFNHFKLGGADINGNTIVYSNMDNDFWDISNGVPVPASIKTYMPAITNTDSTQIGSGNITITTNAVPYGRLSIYDGTQGVTITGNVVTVTDVAQGQTFTVQYLAGATGQKATRTYTVNALVDAPAPVVKEYINATDIMSAVTLNSGDFYSHNTGLTLSDGTNKQHSFNYYGVGGQTAALTSINSQPDDILLTNGGVAIQKNVLGTEYYLEGVLDSTTTAYKFRDGIAGLLVATGPKWVLSATTVESMRLQVGVLGNDIITCDGWGWGTFEYKTFKGTQSVKVCDWTQSFTANELATINRKALKLGVLRYGDNNFAFFINDRLVGYRNYSNINVATSGYASFGESAIGVVASYTASGPLYNGGTSVLDFKYTTDATFIDNLSAKVPTSSGKSIDLFLIAGQSNAAGNAVFNTDTIREKNKTLITGNQDVLYYGTTSKYNWEPMRAGFGEGSNKIGAEAGIMHYLTSLTTGEGENIKYTYDADEGRYAGIIKTAIGGTGFDLSTDTEWMQKNGWWGSPSWISQIGTPLAGTRSLYGELVSATVGAVKQLKAQGFDTIKIKGLFWMQGERNVVWANDTTTYGAGANNYYYKAFNAFVTDLRNDLNTHLKTLIGQDFGGFRVLIGEIAETFGTGDMATTAFNNKMAQNRTFIAMQNLIAQNISGVETLNTQAYPLNRLINGKNYIVGSQYGDHYHWSEDSMFAIGKMVGERIYAY
ncbi:MAG: InlB B-repeat-containing protein [Clostridia bacterium]|nr:InlB B-repeat-containing protein [Clostridia bacterium]